MVKTPVHHAWVQSLVRELRSHVSVCVRSVAKSCLTLWQEHGLYPARLLCPWDSPGKNTGVGCYFLLWGELLYLEVEVASPALSGGFFMAEPSGDMWGEKKKKEVHP